MDLNEEFDALVKNYVAYVKNGPSFQDISEQKENYIRNLFGDLYETYIKNVKLGLGIGPGWLGVYHSACLKLDKYLKEVSAEINIIQVKQKFGELRIYFETTGNTVVDVLDDIIMDATRKAYHTCEICGKEGKLIADGYARISCGKH